ncbi:nucleoside-diphosphate kinase [uncultured Clostridium sp.]|uniref:nucleoside-diphosphate kinase n=1 Tax=uncultured Clostridium sp. TaxID=59620 RepID=UPI0026311C28|nr:nucleoside-diphosphate kinase [uncultured Clostridium sp.]
MIEKSLVLIKPDAVERNLIGEIISIYEKNNLKVIQMNMEHISEEKAAKHYAEHEGKPYFNDLINYLSRSPLVAIIFEGENAIEKVRDLNGPAKNPDPSTIRGKFAVSLTEDAVHGSDSAKNAKREISLWF